MGNGGIVAVRSGLRLAFGIVFSISALGVLAAPAAAETVTQNCQGNCGSWQVEDASAPKRGGSCFYSGSYPYKLTSVSAREPLMHGDYATKTKVGWRFRIQRQNTNGGSWNTIFTSGYQTAKASNSIPAYGSGHGFSRRSWTAPSNPNGYRYRIALDLKWWKPNGNVDGTLSLKYDWYKRERKGGGTDVQPNRLHSGFLRTTRHISAIKGPGRKVGPLSYVRMPVPRPAMPGSALRQEGSFPWP